MTLFCRSGLGALLLLIPLFAITQDLLPPDIGVVEMGAGRLFVNPEGMTLYTFKQDREQPGSSACIEDCAVLWPPVPAAEGATPVGDWSIIRRPDRSQQWAHKQSPVYTYAKDVHPGQTIGVTVSGFWDALFEPMDTPSAIIIHATTRGQTLIDVNGRTVYSYDSATCDAACMRDWLPLEAPWIAGPIGEDWTIKHRPDGLTQWAYQDRPLFTFLGDHKAGDENGDSRSGQVVVLQDAPAMPNWITFQETDFGPVLADENHMTLYYLAADPEQIRRETCDDQCLAENWQAFVAPSTTRPIGHWSTMPLADGTHQWTYLGHPVFAYKHDKIPGDTLGDKFGTGVNIRGGWRAILKETLIQQLF